MSEVHIFSLIKFGAEEHILDLYNNGTIYCNTIEYFRSHEEDGALRGDSYEGTTMIKNYPPNARYFFHFDDESVEVHPANFHIRESYEEIKGNMFCLYSVTREEIKKAKRLTIDVRNKMFGSHFLFVHDCKSFYERLLQGFKENGFRIGTGFVTYYDINSHTGDLGFFHKSNEYEYQKEFRILIDNSKEQIPLSFKIGHLHDVATVYESNAIESVIYSSRT
jgi:hypothetical protein